MSGLQRLLSHLWPIPVERIAGHYQPLELTWERGRLVVNTARANQCFGTLHHLWRAVFRRMKLRQDPPGRVLVLGFGGGSVATILHSELHLPCSVVGVEGDPVMLDLAARPLGAFDQERVQVILSDAVAWARTAEVEPFDLVVVDLFIDLDVPAEAATAQFQEDIQRLTTRSGRIVFNTIAHDEESATQSSRIASEMRQWSDAVDVFVYNSLNRVFIARSKT
ncbi:MAG: hypothetical protein H6595_11425 [Flavobacteriales bacterium]|nr:hypothetical protein [Flavobacteriales bacterium]MCB9168070.1 hypothetical protein [Flavobacteriales bacterium]